MIRHLQWRLRHRFSFASLSGLANLVTTRMPLGVAVRRPPYACALPCVRERIVLAQVWFCYGGCAAQDAVMPRREALRTHLGHAHALAELVALAGHPVSARAKRHIARLRVLSHMMRVAKHGAGVAALRNDVCSLWQASVEIASSISEGGGGGGGAAVDACDELLSPDVRAREAPYVSRVLIDGPADAAEVARVLSRMPPACVRVLRAWRGGALTAVEQVRGGVVR